MLLLVTQPGCSYCEQARHYLSHLADESPQRVLLRELDLLSRDLLSDFDGQRIDQRQLALRLGAGLTPTVLLVGPEGNVLVEPVIGLKLADFYLAYIEQAIRAARKSLCRTDPQP